MATPFQERARAYLEDVRAIYPISTHETYKYYLRALERMAAELGDPAYWGEKEILAMRGSVLSHYAPSSANMAMTVLGNLLLFHGNGQMEQMRRRRRLRMPESERGNLRWHETTTVDLLLTTSTGALRVVLHLGFYLGLRVGEMVSLKLSDIGESTVRIRGKGGKARTLPLEGATREAILYYVARVRGTGPDRLLLHDGTPYRRRGIARMLERHGKRIGKRLSPHDMRRTFGRQLWERGVKIEVISKLMGHSESKTTIRYLGLDLDDMREAIQTLGP